MRQTDDGVMKTGKIGKERKARDKQLCYVTATTAWMN